MDQEMAGGAAYVPGRYAGQSLHMNSPGGSIFLHK